MSFFLLSLALGVHPALAGKYDAMVADVNVSKLIPAPPESVYSYVLDLEHVHALFPTDCVGLFQIGQRSFGEGANAIVRYDMGLMHRKLPMTLVRADAPRYIDFDHVGPKGFVTRWHFDAADGGTTVRIETPLTGPPNPLKGYYYKVVKPAWELCYSRTLDNLVRAASSIPAPAEPATP